jgi:HSP20 family protein
MNTVNSKEQVERKSLIDEIQNQPFQVPRVNISENEDSFIIAADMPGIDKNNIELKTEDNNLTVIGKADLVGKTEAKYILREKRVGNYVRKFKLGESIDQDGIEAKLVNGQLLLTLPKKESVKPRNIEIL